MIIRPDNIRVTTESDLADPPASALPPPPLPEVLPPPPLPVQPTDEFVPSGSFDPGPMPPVRPAQVPDYFT